MVGPRKHARRVIVLLSGRATVYEPGPHGHRLTVSGAEASAVVGVRVAVAVVMADGAAAGTSVVDY